MAEVRFTKDAPVKGKQYKPGEKAQFTDEVAAALVRQGLAELVPAKKSQAQSS